MFASLKGKAKNVSKDKVILDVNNVGFLVNIPEGDAEKIITLGEQDIVLNIHTDIKENDTVKVKGTLFSSALGDAWVDVDSLEEIKK